MKQRGRPSAASLLVVSPPPAPPYIAPPTALSKAEAAVWRTLAALPAGHLRPCDLPTATEYCRAVVRSNELAALLTQLSPADEGYFRILRAAGQQADRVARLAVRLRATPSARTDPRTVHNNLRPAPLDAEAAVARCVRPKGEHP